MKVSDWPSRSNGDGHKNKIVFYELFQLFWFKSVLCQKGTK